MPYLLIKKNQVTKIVDTFTPVHDGAVFANAFAYQVDKGQFGKMTFPLLRKGYIRNLQHLLLLFVRM